ncbi:hypothetical protein JOH48_008391 [Bradyrhizobium elkanii]|nr:hypothetical protein [Bradyrhizobium elkanii]
MRLCPHPLLSSPGLCAIAHMDRAIHYAAAYRLKLRPSLGYWITRMRG